MSDSEPGDDHQADAEAHHEDHHDDAIDARMAVAAAVQAVTAAEESMDGLVAMLGRHFRLGLLAVGVAALIGVSLLYVVLGLRDTQDAFAAQATRTELQTLTNEVEVLRHRVHSKESDLRLCTVALGASRGAEAAAQICAPVLGTEYEPTKAKLALEERRLARLRAAAERRSP